MRNRKSTHHHMFIALLSCCQVQEKLSSYVLEPVSVAFLRRLPQVASHWPNQDDSSFPTRDERVCHLRKASSAEHNVWNPMLASLCHFEIGVGVEGLFDEVGMGRIALACHFSLDILCDKTSSLPVSERNRPPPLPP